jgi:hypothetical protein
MGTRHENGATLGGVTPFKRPGRPRRLSFGGLRDSLTDGFRRADAPGAAPARRSRGGLERKFGVSDRDRHRLRHWHHVRSGRRHHDRGGRRSNCRSRICIGRGGWPLARLIVADRELPAARALTLRRRFVAVHTTVVPVLARILRLTRLGLPSVLAAILAPILAPILTIAAAPLRLAIAWVTFGPRLRVLGRRVIAILGTAIRLATILLATILGIRLSWIAAILAGPAIEWRPTILGLAAILPIRGLPIRGLPIRGLPIRGLAILALAAILAIVLRGPGLLGRAGILRLAIETVAIVAGKFVAFAIQIVSRATVILPETLWTISALRLAAILLCLLLRGRDDAVIMLRMLEIVFGDDPITGRRGVTGEL